MLHASYTVSDERIKKLEEPFPIGTQTSTNPRRNKAPLIKKEMDMGIAPAQRIGGHGFPA